MTNYALQPIFIFWTFEPIFIIIVKQNIFGYFSKKNVVAELRTSNLTSATLKYFTISRHFIQTYQLLQLNPALMFV
jgi:hypothetical protein